METIENEFKETWVKVKDESLEKTIAQCIPFIVDSNNRQIEIYYLAEVVKDEPGDDLSNEYQDKYNVVALYMGKNGGGQWEDYFMYMELFAKNMRNEGFRLWMIDWKNDCADDVSTIRFGFRKE